MFAVGIRYLNGWSMAAADGARKQAAEWPPHPDRVFMALAAAHFETEGDARERRALEWLERLPPPHLAASEAAERDVATAYVPVNDSSDPLYVTYIKGERTEKAHVVAGTFAVGRNRQPRSFPVAIPRDPDVYLIWPDSDVGDHLDAMKELCGKVTYLGHSASMVQFWVEKSPPAATWRPETVLGERRLRITGEGRLASLERAMNRKTVIEYAEMEASIASATRKDKPGLSRKLKELFPGGPPVSRRPEPGLWQGYTRQQPAAAAEDVPGSVFSQNIVVLSLAGRRPGLRGTLKLTAALRGALLAACSTPIPEWVSGHREDGTPSRNPHLAIIPLPFVGREHADGTLLGLGLCLPAALPAAEVAVLGRWLQADDGSVRRIRLYDGEWLECEAALDESAAPPLNLRPETWVGPALRWGTVTPVVFDRHPDGRGRWDAAASTVADACERIGLPRPTSVSLGPVSWVQGAPSSREFAPLPRKRGGRLQHRHALVEFAEPVRGPILLGAGRFRGYGLLRPLPAEEDSRD